MLELDREGRVVDANPTFRRCVPGIVGRQATVAMTRVDALRHAPLWQELVQGTLARYEITATLRRPEGTTVPGRVVVTAVVGADGEVTGAVAVTVPDAAPTASAAAVLTGLASGLTLQQVAARLGLTRRGVDYRLARLRQKLRADGPGGTTVPATTAGVVARGYALGLLTPGTWPPRPS